MFFNSSIFINIIHNNICSFCVITDCYAYMYIYDDIKQDNNNVIEQYIQTFQKL